MSTTPPAIIAAALLVACGGAAASPDQLAALRGRARVLVVVAPGADNSDLAEQLRLYASAQAAARDRDLVLVTAIGHGADARAIRRHFEVPDGAFRAILVGKDGLAKHVDARPVSPEFLFETIDAMPMRQDEMRRDQTRHPKGRERS